MPSTDLPNRMTAIAITAPGSPEVLQPVTVPVPRPTSGDVLIRVAAAGVNRPDCLQRRGLYPPPAGASQFPGLEVAGTVVDIGSAVSHIRVGDTVCALLTGGGYAEYCTAPAVQCLPIPAGMHAIEAAAFVIGIIINGARTHGNVAAGVDNDRAFACRAEGIAGYRNSVAVAQK